MNTFSLKKLFYFEKTPLNLLMAFITVALLAAFMAGAVLYILHGHHAYNVTRQHPWGLLISMYVFFVVSSTGLCIISSIGHVFGWNRLVGSNFDCFCHYERTGEPGQNGLVYGCF